MRTLSLAGLAAASVFMAGCGKPAPYGVPYSLTSALPFDVDVAKVTKLDADNKIIEAQREFDDLAWQAFIALNWPANAQGEADNSKNMSDVTSPRVWQSWRLADSIFLPNGEKPAAWGGTGNALGVPELYRMKAAWRQNTTSADENFQAFSGPLVDLNGKWVRYEVLVNHEEFDYLVDNELYNLDGQIAFSQKPVNNQVEFPVNVGTSQHGAMEIKFSWKELGPGDDRSRFYTTKVKVVTSEAQPQTKTIDVGMVGMHISMRTESSPEWIWSTFEQVDNAPLSTDQHALQQRHNFFNPPPAAPINTLPPTNAPNNSWYESLTTKPVPVERIAVPTQGALNPFDEAIGKSTEELNGIVQGLLRHAHSPFQYYKLIGTQWPVHPNAPAFAGGNNSAPESISNKMPGDMVPVFLINTTMETYFQKGAQPAGPLEQDDRLASSAPPIDTTPVIGTESCVGCHYSAGICIGFKKNMDGTYLLNSAGQRTPVFGENSHFGKTGNGEFSWLLQIEAKAKPYTPAK